MPISLAWSIPVPAAAGTVSACVTHLFCPHAASVTPQTVDGARAYPPLTEAAIVGRQLPGAQACGTCQPTGGAGAPNILSSSPRKGSVEVPAASAPGVTPRPSDPQPSLLFGAGRKCAAPAVTFLPPPCLAPPQQTPFPPASPSGRRLVANPRGRRYRKTDRPHPRRCETVARGSDAPRRFRHFSPAPARPTSPPPPPASPPRPPASPHVRPASPPAPSASPPEQMRWPAAMAPVKPPRPALPGRSTPNPPPRQSGRETHGAAVADRCKGFVAVTPHARTHSIRPSATTRSVSSTNLQHRPKNHLPRGSIHRRQR